MHSRSPGRTGLEISAVGFGAAFDPPDPRKNDFTPGRLDALAPRLAALEAQRDAGAPDLSTLALRFCLHHPAVSTVLPGLRRVRHVDANTQADLPLPEPAVARLRAQAWAHGWHYPWCKA